MSSWTPEQRRATATILMGSLLQAKGKDMPLEEASQLAAEAVFIADELLSELDRHIDIRIALAGARAAGDHLSPSPEVDHG